MLLVGSFHNVALNRVSHYPMRKYEWSSMMESPKGNSSEGEELEEVDESAFGKLMANAVEQPRCV